MHGLKREVRNWAHRSGRRRLDVWTLAPKSVALVRRHVQFMQQVQELVHGLAITATLTWTGESGRPDLNQPPPAADGAACAFPYHLA